MDTRKYTRLKKAELMELARNKKVPALVSMTKAEIIEAIENAGKGKSAPSATGKSTKKRTVRRKARPAKRSEQRDWNIHTTGAQKFFVAREEGDLPTPEADIEELTENYADNRIVAMSRDPRVVFVYWEVAEDKAETALADLGKSWSETSWVLRMMDVTGIEFDGANEKHRIDIKIDPDEGSRYLDAEDDCEYIVAIGLIDNDGQFAPVCASERVRTPRATVCAPAQGEWSVSDETFDKLTAITTGTAPGFIPGLAVSSPGIPTVGVSSAGVSSPGVLRPLPGPTPTENREFHLWVNCELKVYGGTEPSAQVTLQGQNVETRPDGTFSASFPLPDGALDIPVCAISADGVDRKEIALLVSRSSRIVS